MASIDVIRGGGPKLKHVREDIRKITQMDVERQTAARYGPENRVFAQQVSRIEKGQFDKAPILDLLRIGEVLGLQPDDIGEMFSLWPRQTEQPTLDPRVQELIELSQRADFDIREELLNQLEVIIALTRAKLRQRLQERESASEIPGPRERRQPVTHGAERPPGAGAGGGEESVPQAKQPKPRKGEVENIP